ncbi:polyphosphate--glucose phosphotransferase [Lapillicoccus sp.]|uniref:polyphosphate--glucose phosphotransferase n=1 Tax=Lapillicoccus sp. TaxID=1909287 RepID=UPI0027D14BC4|nr:ROK family protein [Actinomycetota bacterium]
MSKHTTALGIDIGGSGIKGAIVDLKKGEFSTKRKKILTPKPATPEAVIAIVAQLVAHFADDLDKDSAVGVTVPAVVQHGLVRSAANIDPSWIDFEGEGALRKALGRDVALVNDADAAGYAELLYGAAKDEDGLVILTTLGTGIGSALMYRNMLVPNSELGHLEIDGHDAEKEAASSVKDTLGLTYEQYVPRLQRYYSVVEALFSPDLFVVGGGISKDSDQFLPLLKLRTPIVAATLQNRAGIIGAARLAQEAAHG